MHLDPRRCDAFLAAVDSGSLEQAAALLHVTPSAVSQRIAALEQDLGAPLLVRSRPCRPTAPGTRLVQFLRRRALLDAEYAAELIDTAAPMRVALAVNNDTLATWLLPLLAPLLIEEQLLVEFVLDNQGHTFALLEQGRAVACISTEPEPMRGCSANYLGLMRYKMVATPGFAQRWFPAGLQRDAARHAPVMVFDRKDALQTQFLQEQLGLPDGAFPFHYMPSSEAFAQALTLGLGYGMLPLEQCAALLATGELIDLAPDVALDVPLNWHAWRVQPVRLERMGNGLVKAARAVLI